MLPLPKAGTGLMTIAFDLDGTLAEATWPRPEIGDPIRKGVDALEEYHSKGYEIVIFTSRPASHRGAIAKWLETVGIKYAVYDIITDKPRYAMFVDDRAVAFPEAFETDDFGPVAIGQRVIDAFGVTDTSFTVRGKGKDYLVQVSRLRDAPRVVKAPGWPEHGESEGCKDYGCRPV